MPHKGILVAVVTLCATVSALAQEDPSIGEYSRQELFTIARLTKPGETLFSLPEKFVFPESTREGSVFGIDISRNVLSKCKCAIDWQAVAGQGVKFVLLKATEGATYSDATFASNAKAVRESGLKLGAYHMITANPDIQGQAHRFLSEYLPNGPYSLIPTLDLEWNLGAPRDDCQLDAQVHIINSHGVSVAACDRWSFVKGKTILDATNLWIDIVQEKSQQKVLVYTNASWWNARIGPKYSPSDLHSSLIWIADYSQGNLKSETPTTPAAVPWHLWQFTSSARINLGSATGHVDASIVGEGGLQAVAVH